MPLAVVDVPRIGIVRSLATGPTANISLDRVGPMIATTLSRPISLRAALMRLVLVAGAILDGEVDLAPAEHALLVHLAERQFHAGADRGAVGGIRAGQDLDGAKLHRLLGLRLGRTGSEQQACQNRTEIPTQHSVSIPGAEFRANLVQRGA